MLYPSTFFEKVTRLHFAHKSRYLLTQLDQWGEFCKSTWLAARSTGSAYLDSYIGVSSTLSQRAEAMLKLIRTASKRLAKQAIVDDA